MSHGVCENVNKTAFKQNCLLKYIINPFISPIRSHWHQNLWQAEMLASIIGEFGYNVDVIDWNDNGVELNKQYDLIIDNSPHNACIYRNHLSPSCIKVLYATTSAPAWQRQQEELRLGDLYRRRGVKLEPRMPLDQIYPHPNLFDGLFLIGNKHTLATFGEIKSTKTFLIKNTGHILIPKLDFSLKSPRNFLFFASHTQPLKGLDLLLEAFSANPEINLYICSLYQQEPEFCKIYEAEMFHRPNIKPVGFVDIFSKAFQEIALRCSYVILPSCSEGMSGSVLSAMSAGLIPIVSRECGLNQDDAYFLKDCSAECIAETVNYYSRKPPEWIREQSFCSLNIIRERYSPQHFIHSVQAAVSQLLGRPPIEHTPEISHLKQKRSAYTMANTRIGIPLTVNKQYPDASHIKPLIKAFAALPQNERPQLYLVITESTLSEFELCQSFSHLFDGIIFLGQYNANLHKTLENTPIVCQSWDELFSILDLYCPVINNKTALSAATYQPGVNPMDEPLVKAPVLSGSTAAAPQSCPIVFPKLKYDITILTSLTCDNIENQQMAIQSWQKAGFKIISLNSPEDTATLSADFPEIEFVPATRNAKHRYGKPYIYFRDLLDCCLKQQTEICGIVKSDTIFKDRDIIPFLVKEARNSIVFGSCQDAENLNPDQTSDSGGFDYIFFDKKVTGCYPMESFCLGLYWWDYWAVLMPIAGDIPGKRLISPIAWRANHQETPNIELWNRLGILLSRYAETDFSVTPDTMGQYQHLLLQTIKDNSTAITFTPRA